MPLVSRTSNQGNLFKESSEPAGWQDADLWTDSTNNVLYINDGGTARKVQISTARLEGLA